MSLVVDIKKNLDNFKLEVAFEANNERLALLGTSGSGKSMTLKCIAGIEKPNEGKIVLNGKVLFDSEKGINLPPQKRQVGYLFQQYALFPNMSVEDNIACGARHLSKPERSQAVAAMLKRVKLKGHEKKRPLELSGGQQQRVALARILINNPRLLMFDEPFSALDSHLRWQLELELAETLKNYQGTALLVSHKQDEVYRLSNSVCVLNEGRAGQKRTVKELFEAPTTLSECRILGLSNISRTRPISSNTIEAIDWGVTLNTGQKVAADVSYIAIKETDIELGNGPGENAINCLVEHIIEDVSTIVLVLSTPGGTSNRSCLKARLPKTTGLGINRAKPLHVLIDPAKMMMICG